MINLIKIKNFKKSKFNSIQKFDVVFSSYNSLTKLVYEIMERMSEFMKERNNNNNIWENGKKG